MLSAVLTRLKIKDKGYALVEVLLAFGVALIVITGMISLGVVTIRATTGNRAYAEAGKLAQRESERLKLLRDTSVDWQAFITAVGSCTSACHLQPSGSSYSVGSGLGVSGTGSSAVNYYFTVSDVSDTVINYVVTTSWVIGNVNKEYMIEGVLSSWRSS